ncbi:hypothetical protein FQR65_LT04075 [Abscondita terminalis]|nr:hypothetical protein FQR65_LT04075 [Abscondita terminalis]
MLKVTLNSLFFKRIQTILNFNTKFKIRYHISNVHLNEHSSWDSKEKIFCPFAEHTRRRPNKISIIGIGNVGQAILAGLLFQKVTDNIAFHDLNEQKVKGELLDFQYSGLYSTNVEIQGSTDLDVITDSRIVVITASARRQENDTKVQLVKKNVEVFQKLIPQIVKRAPNAVLLLVTNPVEIMTYVTVKLSGLPPGQVLGSGTNLTTSRLLFYVSQKYNVAADSCQGWVIGEHGESAVTAFSTITVGGCFIKDINKNIGKEDDDENWSEFHRLVLEIPAKVISMKGYTNWAIGFSVANIAYTIITNNKTIHPVTVLAKGFCGIKKDVYLSLPAVLGENGVVEIVRLVLTKEEGNLLIKSEKSLHAIQRKIKL